MRRFARISIRAAVWKGVIFFEVLILVGGSSSCCLGRDVRYDVVVVESGGCCWRRGAFSFFVWRGDC